ncbi:hypothetical protein [Streptomyces sp. NPDC093795]|uniref:hypothetical protein n=1 Tax=Streptomyces sp. NPDC093795 TaxID=3366051 RepID=UPI0038192B1C
MYGQVPTPTTAPVSARASGPSAATITVRVLITVLVVLSLGLLAWVAMLRVAIMRRSGRDWALFWVHLVLNIACVVPLEERFADTWMNTAGMVALLVQMAIVTCYFLVVDIRHHQPAPVVIMVPPPPAQPPMQPSAQPPYTHQPVGYVPAPQPPTRTPAPGPRIDQVRAELDELSDLLRTGEQGEGRA